MQMIINYSWENLHFNTIILYNITFLQKVLKNQEIMNKNLNFNTFFEKNNKYKMQIFPLQIEM